MKKSVIIGIVGIIIILGVGIFFLFGSKSNLQERCEKESWPPKGCSVISDIKGKELCEKCKELIEEEKPKTIEIHDQSISGEFMENQIWSGEILITGDVFILKDLTILPGTIVRFAVQDDEQRGEETPADGYNDLDPTRLLSYGKSHSFLMVGGKLNASGKPENKIIFTSASENPKIADWESISIEGDGSLIEYAVIEWSRNGITPGRNTPNSIFRNNLIRQTFWGAISAGTSSCRVYNNEIYECGHEGIDVQGGNPIIENNTIYNCHTGIVVLSGSAVVKNNIIKNVGDGIHVEVGAYPILENNQVELASHDSEKEWRYGNFAYVMFGDPISSI
ncbi:MAG: right-handed parallel beta-helix repeat-containing protein [Nanoarchaeota archaeon]|nr:right-handed parallel beta-helix repeat-containing protein [Nanoarchaeota archaeon]